MLLEIGQTYVSRLSDSSGRTYIVTAIWMNEYKMELVAKLKDVNSEMSVNYSVDKIKIWIEDGRLKLIN